MQHAAVAIPGLFSCCGLPGGIEHCEHRGMMHKDTAALDHAPIAKLNHQSHKLQACPCCQLPCRLLRQRAVSSAWLAF